MNRILIVATLLAVVASGFISQFWLFIALIALALVLVVDSETRRERLQERLGLAEDALEAACKAAQRRDSDEPCPEAKEPARLYHLDQWRDKQS
jgi:hypothetical protein